MSASDATVEAIAGATGAALATFAIFPINTISTAQAVRSHGHDEGSERLKFRETVQKIVEERGLLGFYDGLRPTLLGVALSQGVYFYFYSALREAVLVSWSKRPPYSSHNPGLDMRKRSCISKLGRHHPRQPLPESVSTGSLSLRASLLVAATAGSINVLVTNPVWVLATRMQAGRNRQTVREAVMEAYRENGYKWIFQGLTPSLIMVCNPTVQYMLYEWLVKWLRKVRHPADKTPVSALEIFTMSAVAKLGATLLTYPLLVVKSRMQVDERQDRGSPKYVGTTQAINRILNEEGLGGFYKGMGAKMFASVVGAAITLVVKEKLVDATRAMLSHRNSMKKV